MLAEKYDVALLRDACLAFIKDVLDGIHGFTCEVTLLWINYIELHLPDLLHKCFEVLRTNISIVGRGPEIDDLDNLSINHMKILLDPKFGDELTPMRELVVWSVVQNWHVMVSEKNDRDPKDRSEMVEELFPLIRFNNMPVFDLYTLMDQCRCCEEQFKDYVRRSFPPNSKVYTSILCKPEERPTAIMGEGISCTCDDDTAGTSCFLHACSCKAIDQPCIHTNPRLYLVYGDIQSFSFPKDGGSSFNVWMRLTPFDLTKRQAKGSMSDVWEVQYRLDERGYDPSNMTVRESFLVTPIYQHLGRRYTIVISSMNMCLDMHEHGYAKKVTGTVTVDMLRHDLTIYSPRRRMEEWNEMVAAVSGSEEDDRMFNYCMALFLH